MPVTPPRSLKLCSSLSPCIVLFLVAVCSIPVRAEEGIPTPLGPAGVIVEEVERYSLGEKAGLKPGDVLVHWERAPSFPMNPLPAGGTIFSPFDVQEILIEQAPRGALTFHGSRDGQEKDWSLIAGASIERTGIQVRPFFPTEILAVLAESKHSGSTTESSTNSNTLINLATPSFRDGRVSTALWIQARRAEVLLRAGDSRAGSLIDQTATQLKQSGQHFEAARLYLRWAAQLIRAGSWNSVHQVLAKARRAISNKPSFIMLFFRSHQMQALAERLEGKISLSIDSLGQALALCQSNAPQSLDLAIVLAELGNAMHIAGESSPALDFLAQSERLQREIDYGSVGHAVALDLLGGLHFNLGNVVLAENLLQESLRGIMRFAPSSVEAGRILLHLGLFAINRTDFVNAEYYLRNSLSVLTRLPPNVINLYNRAACLVQLASLMNEAGDHESAEYFGRLALVAHRELNPRSYGVAQALEILASIFTSLERYAEARDLLHQALDLHKARSNSLYQAQSLRYLGRLELRDGHPKAAELAFSQAESLYLTAQVRGLFLGYVLEGKGEAVGQRGDHRKAISILNEALFYYREVAPGGENEANILRLLGIQKRVLNKIKGASLDFCQAAAVLNGLRGHLRQTTEGSSRFLASRSYFYTDCIESLLERSMEEQAFNTLEAGRARGLLDIIAQRDLSLQDLSPSLREERKRLREQYDIAYNSLSSSKLNENPEENQDVRERLSALSRELEAMSTRIRRESPHFASLHDPVPLNLIETRSVLDPGTLLLAYSVGEKKSFLFVVQAQGDSGPGLRVFPIAISADRLRDEVQALTTLLADRRSSPQAIRATSRLLYRLLISPAASQIASADRLLIAPDGPLHNLPFGALVRPNGQYLIEAKPIHTIVSATVYAEIKKERRENQPSAQMRVAAFGDPQYPGLSAQRPEEAQDLLVRSALRRGLPLTPLPGTRREVKALGELYPNSEIWVGAEATEEKAKALGKEPRIIHFAGHALLDERMPLNSSLALTIPEHPRPGQENGLLQAWEIFEQVRIDADLVTLSACNTALGKEMGGEGLIGLTRAFQFAGARSVLASLWAIGDSATARFMPRFYQHLRDGMTKDEALRRTQIEWIRGRETSSPFHWAAFQLIGDYR